MVYVTAQKTSFASTQREDAKPESKLGPNPERGGCCRPCSFRRQDGPARRVHCHPGSASRWTEPGSERTPAHVYTHACFHLCYLSTHICVFRHETTGSYDHARCFICTLTVNTGSHYLQCVCSACMCIESFQNC